MSLFNWEEFNLSLGIPSIDDQHKKLFSIINKLYESSDSDDINEVLKGIISELLDYTNYHFSTEIELISQSEYPDVTDHKAAHNVFTQEVIHYKKLADENKLKTSDCSMIFNYLIKWLSMHIDKIDRKYAPYLETKD